MTSILLVRHADAPWSPDEMRPLSPEGELAAHRLAAQLSPLSITAVYSSPYRRAVQTVTPLAAHLGLPVREISGLRERSLGSFGPASFEEAVAHTWGDFDLTYSGGESSREAQRRGMSSVGWLADRHPDGLVVASTHGNLLALVLNAFDSSVGFEFWRSLRFPDVLRVDLRPSRSPRYYRPELRAI